MFSMLRPHRGGYRAVFRTMLAVGLVGCGAQNPTFQSNTMATSKDKRAQDLDATAQVLRPEALPAEEDAILKSLQAEKMASDGSSADANGIPGMDGNPSTIEDNASATNPQASNNGSASGAGDGMNGSADQAAGGSGSASSGDELASNQPGAPGSSLPGSGSGDAIGSGSGGGSGSGSDSGSGLPSPDPIPAGSEGGVGLPGGSGSGGSTDIGQNDPASGDSPSSSDGSTQPGGSTDSGSTPGGSTGGGDDIADNGSPSGGSNPSPTPSTDGSGTTPGGSTDGQTPGSDTPPPAGDEDPVVMRDYTFDLVQKEARKVDILWIVDSSGSMSEEQAYLGNNFNSFISGLAESDYSFHTGVTSTDICPNTMPADLAARACPANYGGSSATRHQGSLVGQAGARVLSSETSNLVSLFNSYTQVGINGSGFEHGLKAAEMAVAKSLAGANENLVRDDAFLSIIVVSDEEDDGVGLSQTDIYTGYNFFDMGLTTYYYDENNLINYLNTAKGAGNYSISTITGTRESDGRMCTSPHSQPQEEGTTYIKAATKTGGMVQSICATNWANSLYKIGQDLNAQITQVHLENHVVPSTIKVFVDGVQVNGWSFVEGSNSIKFNTDAVPVPGSQIHIEYRGLVD